ncbi:glycosyltransferase 87 family protein [Actinoallomurus rhizosphaericola]|uniref:glycosyltransferase 87 family protein n=1 Tax=Actinoallomurus rhizosphaericola TaxID=2952536 RepID=UPI002092BE96|nr:glycosyltransferase 87 family protein [Actinoallomurus rhizosphaericola]MCO5998559.1 glycosyltransferase 87 family protein [Actinoallomurus rhizosphaericola]
MAERRTKREIAMVVAGLAIVVAAVGPLALHWLTNAPDQRMVDLDVYRSGGQAVLRGAPVYDFMTQPPQLLPFTYPPFAVLLAVPLAFLPWAAAQWVWAGLILLALTVTVRYAFRGLLQRFPAWAPVLTGVLVAICAYPMPLRDQFRFGQVDVFLVAMCVADCAAPRTRWPRGLLVGLATAIKLTPGVFVVYFLVTGRRREAVNAVVGAAVATLGTFLVLPADSADYWFGALFDSERLGSNTATTNQSIRGMLLRAYLPSPVVAALWLACAALIAYVGFRAARRAAQAGDEIGAVAITGLVGVLVSPVSWIHHLAWLVVVLGALAGTGRDRKGLALAAGVWLFYVLTIPWWGIDLLAHHVGPRPIGRIVQDAYGLGALVLLFVFHRRRPAEMGPGRRSESDRVDASRDEPKVGTLGS